MEPNRIFSPDQITVPSDLPEVLKKWTKEVIRNNPDDILRFSAEYFQKQIESNQSPEKPSVNLDELKSLFDKYDTNGNGSMDTKELKHFVQHDLGYALSDEQMEQVIATLDQDGSGALQFDEVVQWWTGQC